MNKTSIALTSLATSLLCLSQPGFAQTGGYIVGSPQATIRGGASANVDIVEGGGSGTSSGTISVKYSATLDTARKHYAKFTLTGAPNTNGSLWLRYDTGANSQRQDVSIWTLDQDFAAFTSSALTWNTAQANDVSSGSGFLTTGGGSTATYYQNFLSSSTGNNLDFTHQLNGPWGHMIQAGNVIYMALSSTNNIGDSGLRLAVNSLEIGYDMLTSGAPPSIGAIANMTVSQGQTSAASSFTVGDPEDGPTGLSPVATSSDEAVVPAANVLFGGTGANRTVSLTGGSTPGAATITVSIVDSAGNQATRAFRVTVQQANAAPIIICGGATNLIAPTNTLLNTPVEVPFSVSDAETVNSALTVSAEIASYSAGILESAVVTGTDYNTNLSVVVTPQPGVDGVGVVRLSVSDPNGNATNAGFCVMIRSSAKVVFIDHFEYDGLNTKLTDQAPNLWTRRNASAQSVFFRSATDPFTLAKVAWIRPNSGAEDMGAPLVGGPYSPASRAVLYTKFTATFADQASGGAGINTITNGEGAWFRLSPTGGSTTDFVNYLSVSTNGVSDPASEFRVFVANGTDNSTPWPQNFTKPVNLSTETGPITLVTRYDVAEGRATLWVNGLSESDPRVVGTDYQAPVSVGYVGMFQERGNGDIYLDDLSITMVIKPLITAVSQPSGGSVDLDFSAGATDAVSDFQVEGASTITGSFTTVSAAITSLGGGSFQARVAAPGSEGYYKVKRTPITF